MADEMQMHDVEATEEDQHLEHPNVVQLINWPSIDLSETVWKALKEMVVM